MEIGLLVVFLYGVMHALGPDHLLVIANFSIGQQLKRTAMVTLLFALGHGVTLLVFAYLLQQFPVIAQFAEYGDVIAASLIMLMGLYLLYLVFRQQIYLQYHQHQNETQQSHMHVSFSKQHSHHYTEAAGVLTLGVLMGIGGLRGMLVSVGLAGQELQLIMLVWFVLGVCAVFMVLGGFIYLLNRNLNSVLTVRRIFAALGLGSVAIGGSLLFGA